MPPHPCSSRPLMPAWAAPGLPPAVCFVPPFCCTLGGALAGALGSSFFAFLPGCGVEMGMMRLP
jgi:hypothetical protein